MNAKAEVAVLMLHSACQMRCPFCVTEGSLSPMSFDQAAGLLKDLRAEGFNNVVFGGGEPTLWRGGLEALARLAKQAGFLTQVGSNGIAMEGAIASSPFIDRWVLPLESPFADTHDRMRPLEGSHHALILERLERLRREGREVTLSTVVTRENGGELEDLADFLEGYVERGGRVHAWHLYRFLPLGRGGWINSPALGMSQGLYDACCDSARARVRSFRAYKRPDMFHSHDVDFFWFEGAALRRGSVAWGGAERGGIQPSMSGRAS